MPQTGSIPSWGASARSGPQVLPGDELGEDRDGDLLLGRRPEVEPRRRADAEDGLLVVPGCAEPREHGGGALGARHEPDVVGPGAERLGQELLVAVAHRRDHDRVGALDSVVLHPPADRARQLAERARRGAVAEHRQERRGQHRLDQHFDDSFRGASALHAGEPRLPVRERAERLADDRRLRARAADPAGEPPVGRDDRAVALLGRRRTLDLDDGRERVRLSRLRELSRLDDDVRRVHSARPASWSAAQTFSEVTGISRLRIACVRERVDDGVHERRGRADRRRLADALGADRMVRRRRDRLAQLERRRLPGRRDQVVHDVGADAVAVLVEVDQLHRGDREALGEAAHDLALDDHRVDPDAAVVHGHAASSPSRRRCRGRPRPRRRRCRTGRSCSAGRSSRRPRARPPARPGCSV